MISGTHNKVPFGQLGVIAMKNCRELGNNVDYHLKNEKTICLENGVIDESGFVDSYLVPINEVRFSNGEGKISLKDTARGKDIYIISDVGNYSCTYDLFGIKNHMGPDEHFQDIKRVLSSIGGKARRITVIMPLLYASRQHKRKGRESMDCAMALQELERMGVDNIITFDAHDPTVQNAIPLINFENLYPTYEIIKTLAATEKDLIINKSSLMVISPDTGAMDRAIIYKSILGVDVGLFYKRRDYSKVINGKNPIIQHEYLGNDIEGRDVLIVDDMIASGESILDIAKELKNRGAHNIYVAVTFSFFTEGTCKFNELYESGLIKRVYSTNLTYIPGDVKEAEWFTEVDMSHFIADLINRLNYDETISPLFDDIANMRRIIANRR